LQKRARTNRAPEEMDPRTMGYAIPKDNDMKPTSLTLNQKLGALAHKYYQHAQWNPKVGDYYTSSRNDLELYQIIDEDDSHFHTIYCSNPEGERSKWLKEEFTTQGFGLNRVHVPNFILNLDPECSPFPA
jgi:hypothetical protein